MGWPKGKPRKTVTTPSGNHHVAVVTKNSEKSDDPIKEKNQEIAKERSKLITKTKPKLFEVQIMDGTEKLNWLSVAMAQYFGFPSCGYSDGIRRWDFPYSVKDKYKRHTVFRKYAYQQIMVDAFEQDTPKAEILRIKAHLEKLGFKYTYIIAGEPKGKMTMEEYMEIVFKDRLKKSDEKALKAAKVPKNLAEAGFAGHNFESR